MDNSLIHHEQVGSLAPIDDLQQKNDVPFKVGDKLQGFFRKLRDTCDKHHNSDWLTIKKGWVKCRNYFDNKQYGYVDDQMQWVDFQKDEGEITYTDNAYQGYIMSMLTELMRSKPNLAFSHISGPDSRTGELIARIAEARYKIHRRALFRDVKVQQEKLSALLNGVAARYTYFDHSERGEKVPVFGENPMQGGVAVVCAMCDSPKSEGECPNCGGSESKEITADGSFKIVTGYEDTKCGKTDWAYVDPLGLTFYLNATTVAETPYIHWKQVVLTSVLQSRFPDVKISEGVHSQELRDQYDSASASPLTGAMSSGTADLSEWMQCWWDVSLYGHYKTETEIRLRGGQVIPANTKLGEVFPNGVYVAFQGETIVDVWPEDRLDKWTIAPFVTRPGTMVGAGTAVAIGNQDIKNDLRTLQLQSAFNDAFAKEFVNMQYIEGDTIPNNPSERAIVTGLPQGMSIVGNVIDRLPPTSLSSDAYGIEERIDSSMQAQLGAFSLTGSGAPDLKAVQDTASGFLAYREMAVGRYGPMLMVMADALDREQAYQFLLNDQRYLTPKQWQQVKGEYGAEALKLFLNCDLRKELIIEVVPDSYAPTSVAQKQGQVRAFGQTLLEMQVDPRSEMGAYIGKQFQIPENLIGFNAQYDAARTHVEAFKMVSDMIVEQFGDVMTPDLKDPRTMSLAGVVLQQAQQSFDPELDDGLAMIESLKDWWGSDEGRGATNLLKATVSLRVREIKAGGAEAMANEQALAMAANAPQMQMEQEQQAAQEESANEMAVAERMADEMSAAETEERESEKEAGREAIKLAESEADRQHQLELAKLNNEARTAAQ